MKILNTSDSFEKLSNAFVTTGTYDGVHKGHRKILQALVDNAKRSNGISVVITFWPHPKRILGANPDIKSLSTLEEKITILESIGIDYLVVIPFNREFSELTSEEFIQKILLDKIGTKKLFIGYDHKFGKNREGSFESLKQNSNRYGFEVEEISREDLNEVAISSTEIRNALLVGDVTKAHVLLTQPYAITGLVVKGKQLGRTIGFPTANIQPNDSDKLIPADGVYAVLVKHKKSVLKGMLNIGMRPTVEGSNRTIEVNILGFDQEIYGEELTIQFINFIRAEKKFNGLDALKQQLFHDQTTTESLLSSY